MRSGEVDTMKLVAAAALGGFDVLRDAEFATLGLLSNQSSGSLVFLENEGWEEELAVATPNVACVLTTARRAAEVPSGIGLAVAEKPRQAFYELHNRLVAAGFYWTPFATTIAGSAQVHPHAFVAERSVRIGERCIIEPNATILECTILEDDVIVRAGSVLGGEGFQVAALDGRLLPVRHGGGVRLERGVEIWNNSVVARAVFDGLTTVGEGTAIDNLVQIAHNVRLGRRNRLAAGAKIMGSVVSGDDVWFGPMCCVADGLRIGHRAHVTIGSVVTQDVPDGTRVTGNFAIDHRRFVTHLKSIR